MCIPLDLSGIWVSVSRVWSTIRCGWEYIASAPSATYSLLGPLPPPLPRVGPSRQHIPVNHWMTLDFPNLDEGSLTPRGACSLALQKCLKLVTKAKGDTADKAMRYLCAGDVVLQMPKLGNGYMRTPPSPLVEYKRAEQVKDLFNTCRANVEFNRCRQLKLLPT